MIQIRSLFRSLHYPLIYGIKNLVQWFPTVWRDREWDYNSFYEVIRFKLSKTEKYFRKHRHHLNAEKDADNMHKCIEVLSRLIKNDYWEKISEGHDKKWGRSAIDFVPSNKKGFNLMRIKRSNVITKEDVEQQGKEFKKMLEREEYLISQDLSYVFGMLEKQIRNWWS